MTVVELVGNVIVSYMIVSLVIFQSRFKLNC